MLERLQRYLPGLGWLKGYDRAMLADDALAGLITAILLIPQSLAYALLAGLPPQAGLYASIAPLVAYALFGSSRALAVGPVAVVSLMTAAAIANLGLTDPAEQMAAAGALALLSSLFLILFGVLKLGSVANFLSRPVVSAFITASTLLIILSQLKHILGIQASGATIPELLLSMSPQLGAVNTVAVGFGIAAVVFLLFSRHWLPGLLDRTPLSEGAADAISRSAPAILVIVSATIAWMFSLNAQSGLPIVGALPTGLPPSCFRARNSRSGAN